MEKTSRLESRTTSRRGFLKTTLAGALGLVGLVGLDNSTACAEESQAKPNQGLDKIDYVLEKDPFVNLRQFYGYKGLKKSLGKEYENMPKSKLGAFDAMWELNGLGYEGLIHTCYLRGIYTEPEKFIKAIPETNRKSYDTFDVSKVNPKKQKRMLEIYPWLDEDAFDPKKVNEKRKLLIWMTDYLSRLDPKKIPKFGMRTLPIK